MENGSNLQRLNEETRERRLKEVIRLTLQNKKIDMK